LVWALREDKAFKFYKENHSYFIPKSINAEARFTLFIYNLQGTEILPPEKSYPNIKNFSKNGTQ